MKHLRNETGMALVMALILSLITLAMVSALLYFATQGTEISAIQKRYQTASEAGYGGTEFFIREVISKTINGMKLSDLASYGGMLTVNAGDACFNSKLHLASENWPSGCSSSLAAKNSPDITVNLAGLQPQQSFNVYAKIVDTIEGNTDTGGADLLGEGVIENGFVKVQQFPIIYRIEVQGESATNPDERANYSVLYAY